MFYALSPRADKSAEPRLDGSHSKSNMMRASGTAHPAPTVYSARSRFGPLSEHRQP
jgi:hypothetical protein